jgi:hypothetical protein
MPLVASSNHPDTPFYRYDPNLGSPRDKYTRADFVHREARGPEVAGVFVANVEGETMINTMWGRRIVPWHAEPGTPCIILGYWSDGSVHVQWPAISGQYRVDARSRSLQPSVPAHRSRARIAGVAGCAASA